MCVAAAIIGAAVIGAAGSAIAGSEAAGATTSATNQAIGFQESALANQNLLSAPYRQLGESAIPQLQQLLGLTGPGSTPGAAQTSNVESTLASTPGYQFALSQGLAGVQNSAAARGMLGSGNTLEALQTFGTGLADSTYQSAVGNLERTVGLGQAAAAGQAANVGSAANNLSTLAVNQGNTLAGIDANLIAGITGAAGGAANQYLEYNTLQSLLHPSPNPTGYPDPGMGPG